MNPFILIFLGFLLIFLEFYVPGAIMGIAGGMFVLASIILFAIHSQSPIAVVFFIAAAVIGLVFLVKFAIWRIRTAKPEHSIYLNSDQEGYQASHFDQSAIGKRGIVDTDLKPGGHVIVDGKRLLALSQSGYLIKGSQVVVVGGQEESLIVKLYKEEISL